MAIATDAQFNSTSREIDMKIDIYFDGIGSAPTTITKDNFLISADILEEVGADAVWPLGDISCNELSFSLFNTDDQFSATNASGPYYGKIVQKVPMKPYFKIATSDWLPMGEFFLFDWNSANTSGIVMVTAYDILWDLDTLQVDIGVLQGATFKAVFEAIFTGLNITATVDAALTDTLAWAYVDADNKVTLQLLVEAASAIIHAGRDGVVYVDAIDTTTLRATITDANQIKEIDTKQGILKTYSGAAVSYIQPQILKNEELLNLSAFDIEAGLVTNDGIKFSNWPVVYVTAVILETYNAVVTLPSFEVSSKELIVKTSNGTGGALIGKLSAYGAYLNIVEMLIADTGSSLLQMTNKYIQTTARAQAVKTILDNYIASAAPTLELSVRGNPLLLLGDKITATSTYYNVNYTGIIQRAKYMYQGSLSCEMRLVDSGIFGGA